MRYLIDGYNLLHHVGRLQPGRGNLGAARLDLLRLLHQRFKDEAVQVTVVFDARKSPPAVKDQEDYHGIEVRFTRYEEADDLIESVIRSVSAPQLLTVVSNDRRIKEAARRRRCGEMECVEFWATLIEKPRPARAAPAAEPERPPQSGAEVEHWVKEFGDLDGDAGFKELFDDGFGG
jgi:predicted RNA-binding protein with PIN domain